MVFHEEVIKVWRLTLARLVIIAHLMAVSLD